VLVAAMVDLKLKPELFYTAHQVHPNSLPSYSNSRPSQRFITLTSHLFLPCPVTWFVQLVETYPLKGTAWFAVGAYYLAAGKFDLAQRNFQKATKLDPAMAAAWIGKFSTLKHPTPTSTARLLWLPSPRLARGDDLSTLSHAHDCRARAPCVADL
jgi:tetratricopeptide (TPR) repeat protein